MRCLTAGWLVAGNLQPAWSQTTSAEAPKPPVIVEAAELRAHPDIDITAEGDAKLRQGKLEISADHLSYDQTGDIARGQGNVSVTRDGNRYGGSAMQLQVERFEGYFDNPTYFFSRTQAGGSAKRIDFLGNDVMVATGANYTSCQRDGAGTLAWLLTSDSVELDLANNVGVAKGAVLRFYDVPILAAPTLSFPLTDARKSGLLPPSLSIDNKSGVQLAVPYYWNIAPNRDATITPSIISKRGLGLNTEFRYLEPAHQGKLNLDVLANDRLTGHTRGSLGMEQEGTWLNDGFYKVSLARVSDDDYWKDFPRDYPGVIPRLLAADVQANKDFGDWTTYARVLRWQALQGPLPTQAVADQIYPAPYDRLPQIGVRGTQRLWGGIQVALEGEYNRFTKPDGSINPAITSTIGGVATTTPAPNPRTGSRVHALSSVSWAYQTPGWTFVPKLSVNAASYNVDQPIVGGAYAGRTEFSRTIPSFSLDSAWVLERDTSLLDHAMRQTLEPRLLYVRTPFRDQTYLPNFDSAGKDFNFDSIYTDNDFSGIDRVSDANQLTAGVTTRMLDAQTGAEAVRLGVAQRFLFSDQLITPDGTPSKQRVSDLLLLGSTTLWPQWKLDAGVQYSPDIGRTVRSTFAVRYSPGAYRTVNVGYRLSRDTFRVKADGSGALENNQDGSEQVELGWQWPLYGPTRDAMGHSTRNANTCSGAWYSVGRVSYSMRDSRITDSVLGLEYDAGCWIGRIVAKRLSTSQVEATTGLGFEIEFIGLSRLGTNPLKVLKDNIPGYRLLRDDTATPATAP